MKFSLLFSKNLLKNTAYLMTSEFSSKLVSFFITILLARFLGVTHFGTYSFIMSFIFLFSILLDFGFNTIFIRDIAKNKKLTSPYFYNILILKLILSVFILFIFASLAFLVDKFQEIKFILLIAGFFMLLNSFTQYITSIFRAYEKTQYLLLTTIVEKISLLFLIVYAVRNNFTLSYIFFVYILVAVVGLLLAILFVILKFKLSKPSIQFSLMRYFFLQSWPLALSNFLWIIYFKIDVVMLYFFKTSLEVGIYNAAYSLFTAFYIIPSVLQMALLPYFSKMQKQQLLLLFSRYAKLFFLFSFLIIIPVFLFSPFIIQLLYGNAFFQSSTPLRILIVSIFFSFQSILFNVVFQVCSLQKLVLKITLLGVLFNVVANLLVIQKYSYFGVSFTTLFTELLIFLLLFYYYKHYLQKKEFSHETDIQAI